MDSTLSMRPGRRGRTRRWGPWTRLGATSLALLLVAAPAGAVPYFNGPLGFGFDNETLDEPLPRDFSIRGPEQWQAAGSESLDPGGEFVLSLTSKTKVRRKPKDGRIRVKVRWKVRNTSGEDLENAFLFFSALGEPPDFPDYSDIPIDIRFDQLSKKKAEMVHVAHFVNDGQSFDFLGFLLDEIRAGKKKKIKFDFEVEAEQLVEATPPALGLAAVIDPEPYEPVPEPAAWVLLGVGAGGLVWWRRRHRA